MKISDFGLSSLYIGDAEGTDGTSRTELLHTTCGTPNYVAPEVLSDQGYDGKKADVWSCGVILYVLLAGFLPFDESTIVALFAKIQNADFTYPSWFSPEVRSLLDNMLVADPKVRLSLTQIKEHPWYNGGTSPILDIKSEDKTANIISVPTEAQMEAAVQPLSVHQKEGSVESDSAREDDFEDFDHKGLTSLNAFDLVSQCGGFMLDRMFSPEIFYTLGNEDKAIRPVSAASAAKNKSFLAQKKLNKSKVYHFTSSGSTPQDLIKFIFESLESEGYDFESTKESVINNCQLKASLLSAKGRVGMLIQVFILTPTMNLLEIRKGKGDIMEWNNAFNDLVNNKLSTWINIPKNLDSDEKEYA